MKNIVILLFILPLFAMAQSNNDFERIPRIEFYQKVCEGNIGGYTSIEKFGENAAITTTTDPADVWDAGGIYVFSDTADIAEIASSSNSDTQEITIIGLGRDWNEITQVVTLTGQTPVILSSYLVRAYRMYNSGEDDFVGSVYLCDTSVVWASGVPGSASDIRAKISIGNNQTLMCIYTVPNGKTGYFIGGYVSMASSGVQNQSATFTWRARVFGSVFAVKSKITCAGNGSSSWDYTYSIPLALPARADVLIRCDEVTATMGVSGGFTVLLKDN